MTQDARAFNWDSIAPTHAHSADPAAGAQIADRTLTKRALLMGVYFSVVNAVAAANRIMELHILPDGTTVFRYAAAGTLITGQTGYVTFTPTATFTVIAGVSSTCVAGGFGPLDLPVGAIIRLSYTNMNGADDLTAATYTFKEAP